MVIINLLSFKIRILLAFFLISLLTSCGTSRTNLDRVDTTNLGQLEGLSWDPRAPATGYRGSSLRTRLLKETALTVGAQGGLAWASYKMNCLMERDSKYLDTIYNFNGMMLSHGVIPPVLVEGDFSLNLADPNTIRVADRTYKIVKQARFATTPPNWREYLLLTYLKPPLPHRSLLPKNCDEQKIWKIGVREGWERGIEQSYSIFQQSLARLKRDYRGMILYRKLLEQKMISMPFVARTELGITGDGNEMRINDQVLRIVELPQLQTSGKHWKAIVVKR